MRTSINRPGLFAYTAGTAGTATIPAAGRVYQVTCHASGAGATFTINGGATIQVISGTAFSLNFGGILIAPTLVFTNTDAFYVDWVTNGANQT